jgi:MFS family permease
VPADPVSLESLQSTPDFVRRSSLFTISGCAWTGPDHSCRAVLRPRFLGAQALQVGLLFTAFALMQILTTPILGLLSDWFGADRC